MDRFSTSHPNWLYAPRPQIIGRSLVHCQPLPVSNLHQNSQFQGRQRQLTPAIEEEREEYIPNVPESFYIPPRTSVPIYQARKVIHSVSQPTTNIVGQVDDTPVLHYYRSSRACNLLDLPPSPSPLPVELWENDTAEFVENDVEKQAACKRFRWNHELQQKIFDDTKLNCDPGLVSMRRVSSLKRQSALLEDALEREKMDLETTREYCKASLQSFKESSAKFHSEMEKLSKPISQEDYNRMVEKYYNELKKKLALNPTGTVGACECEDEMRRLVANQIRERSGISKEAFEHLYKEEEEPHIQHPHQHLIQPQQVHQSSYPIFSPHQLERAYKIKSFLRRVFTTKFNTWKNVMLIQGISQESIYEKEQQHLKRLEIMDTMDPIQIERFQERVGRPYRGQRQARRVSAVAPTEQIVMGFDLPPAVSTGMPVRNANSLLLSGGGLVEVNEPVPVAITQSIPTDRLPPFTEIWAPENANQFPDTNNASIMQRPGALNESAHGGLDNATLI